MASWTEQTYSTILLEPREEGRLAILTLNRPEARNAISRVMANEFRHACEALGQDRGPRAMVVAGAGDRAFSAGADLVERRELRPDERAAHTAAVEAAAEALAGVPFPTIAAVRGFALGGGAELAIACDLRLAGQDAEFGFPEVTIGVFPGAGGVRRLPALVGLGAARDLLYTGRRIAATEAARIGLVDRVVESSAVFAEAIALASTIADNAPLAIRAVKRALSETVGIPAETARERINALRGSLDSTDDYEEGLAAFAERRRPRFSGV
ncbi:MAG: enoyl-CoA hydratase/isomerase family protein [Chloroflexia bacterium]|nr:enoyl-CoA hydratase/isomerase family protein [Chloroflexia bacterium]